ncbi:2943_t:CDS:2 [Paraglomus brasilianum]|uniref:2943_t:CDS:1 n=1 Tax=Paraglomus brasilianum TaxID=144538 RepID=A0A9N9AIB5_9GLOM|nr:2943_t:CDS:2 [Paraglomus brasilianum]
MPYQIDLANEYCVSQSSISEILLNREKWLSIEFITIDDEVPIEHLDNDKILAIVQEKEGDDEKQLNHSPNVINPTYTEAEGFSLSNRYITSIAD